MEERAFYNAVWDILVNEAGASREQYERDSFVEAYSGHHKHPTTEWRFRGLLGFGGKLWRNGGRLYVTCYSEDETPARKAVIDAVNQKLAAMPGPNVGVAE